MLPRFCPLRLPAFGCIGPPVLIGDPTTRLFLEKAQYLGGLMASTLVEHKTGSKGGAAVPGDALDHATKQLGSAGAPLLQALSPEVRDSIQRIGATAKESE